MYKRKTSRAKLKNLDRSFKFLGQIDRFKGAILSANSAALLGIFLKTIGPFTRFFDSLIYNALISKNSKENGLPPCLMIIGPPRSGSTMVYQALVRTIPCIYISNLHSLFPKHASLLMSTKGVLGISKYKFNNYYGYTSSIYDVNEGNEIIRKLFKPSISINLIRSRFIEIVNAISLEEERPFIFKNISAYLYISLLHKAIPEMFFLRIKRDHEQVIQSVVRAFHELGTFNPVPPALFKHDINDPLEFAVRQVLEIERAINLQKNQISPSHWIEWWYDDFCSDPLPMIENLAENYFKIKISSIRKDILPKLKISNRVKVTKEEEHRISLLLKLYSKGYKKI